MQHRRIQELKSVATSKGSTKTAEVVGINSSQPAETDEVARQRAEYARLAEAVKQLQAERDVYREAAYAWALAEVTEEDLPRYAQEEEGLPLKAFLRELEQLAEWP